MLPIVKAKQIIRLPLAKTIPAKAELLLTISPYATPQERNVAIDRLKQLEEDERKRDRKQDLPPPRIFLVVNTDPQGDTPQDRMIYNRLGVRKGIKDLPLIPSKKNPRVKRHQTVQEEGEDIDRGGRYWIYFRGTRNGEHVDAANMNSAKWIFAQRHGLTSLAYVGGSRGHP